MRRVFRPALRQCSASYAGGSRLCSGGAQPRISVVRHPPPAAFVAPDSAVALSARPEWVSALKEAGQTTPAGEEMFAVVKLGGAQHKLVEGDKLVVNKVPGAVVGEALTLSGDDGAVLLVGDCQKTVVGRPGVPGASVTLSCEEQTRDAKILIFRKRRRKNSRRKRGYRRDITVFRVDDISYEEA